MSDQLLLDICSVLIRYVVQQVADTPCHMYLFCVLEVGTVCTVLDLVDNFVCYT